MNLVMCKRICKECPFRTTSIKGWLGAATVDQTLDYQSFEGLFSCHMTRDDNVTEEAITEGKYPICRGFIASAVASCKQFGSHPVNGQALRELQEQITPEDKELVLTQWDFRKHHTLNLKI